MINLITGGAGFIGSNLSKHLLSIGQKVIVFDDLSTGDINNLSAIKNSSDFYFFRHSILDRSLIEDVIQEADAIYHLAAAVGVDYVCKDSGNTKKINILGTKNIVSLAAKYNKRLLFTSSSEVYSNHNLIPFREKDISLKKDTNNIHSIYGKTKIIGERIVNYYIKTHGLKAIIIRLFNVGGYGQKDDYGMVIPKFVKCAISNRPLLIYGDGQQTRTFIHVNDAIYFICALMKTDLAFGKTFNIGGKEEISIAHLSKRVIKLLNSSSSIEYLPYKKTIRRSYIDIKRRVPDISKLQKHLGLSKFCNLEDIIIDTAKFIIVSNSSALS